MTHRLGTRGSGGWEGTEVDGGLIGARLTKALLACKQVSKGQDSTRSISVCTAARLLLANININARWFVSQWNRF